MITGQGTVALEILDDAPGLDTLLVTGGGGLIAGAAAVAAILAGRYCPAAGERVCAVVCGAGTDGFISRGTAGPFGEI